MYLDVPGCTKYLQGPSHLRIYMEVACIYYVIAGISSHCLIFMQELSNELTSYRLRLIIDASFRSRFLEGQGKEVKISLNPLVSIPHLGIAITQR
ncbi:hypothetical protein ACN38_g3717 [Penicillium nordicum]|uniref:Uncharacterized protein n=1 Tax=Penicillium nordicum TaxID=229535 RepID=A0A0M8P7U9_9EURO|nr:hypothetical protein ACN38_g3717 [Penicillium nordicum]